jgi:hypothetical protein
MKNAFQFRLLYPGFIIKTNKNQKKENSGQKRKPLMDVNLPSA